jgi:uncharacterized protein involved in copper resistance
LTCVNKQPKLQQKSFTLLSHCSYSVVILVLLWCYTIATLLISPNNNERARKNTDTNAKFHYTTPQHTIPHHTTQHHTAPHSTIQHNTAQHHAMPHHTILNHIILYHSTRYHNMPHHTTDGCLATRECRVETPAETAV